MSKNQYKERKSSLSSIKKIQKDRTVISDSFKNQLQDKTDRTNNNAKTSKSSPSLWVNPTNSKNTESNANRGVSSFPTNLSKEENPRPVFEKESPSYQRDKKNKENFITQHDSGQELSFLDQNQKVKILNLKAIPKEKFQGSSDEILMEKLGYVFVNSPMHEGVKVDLGGYPVVAKKSNGMVGVMTGVLMVAVKSETDVGRLTNTFDLTLNSFDLELKRAYFSVNSSQSLPDLLSTIQQDKGVVRASLEIIFSHGRL
ncbi:MAG: hypothetical protein K1X29_04880 [Bdellovibrionales bacterium]|nr:hypothetical protein [Bdellovibrionales bacterium]